MRSRSHAWSARLCLVVVSAGLTCFLGGCGGSHEVSEDAGSARYYAGSFRQNQSIALMSFDGGLVYGLYQDEFLGPAAPEFAYAGFFKASFSGSDRTRPRSGQDFRFNSRQRVDVRLVDFDIREDSLDVSVQSAAGTEPNWAARATIDQWPTDSSLLAGSYVLQARSTDDSLKGQATISAAGEIQAVLPNGCQVSVTLRGRPSGNLYDSTAQFGAFCAVARGSLKGHAFQSYPTRNVYVLLTAGSSVGVLLLLVPPTQ